MNLEHFRITFAKMNNLKNNKPKLYTILTAHWFKRKQTSCLSETKIQPTNIIGKSARLYLEYMTHQYIKFSDQYTFPFYYKKEINRNQAWHVERALATQDIALKPECNKYPVFLNINKTGKSNKNSRTTAGNLSSIEQKFNEEVTMIMIL